MKRGENRSSAIWKRTAGKRALSVLMAVAMLAGSAPAEPSAEPEQGVPVENTAAVVLTRDGETAYADMASAWDAAVAAGDATIEMKTDWVSDAEGIFGTGINFSPEGSIVMDASGTITIEADGYTIRRDGEAVPGGCVFGVFAGSLVIRDAVISGGGIFVNTDAAELTLPAMVDATGNTPMNGDLFLAGNGTISLDSMADNSYLTISAAPFEPYEKTAV